MIVVSLLMLNLLIATLGETYASINEAKKEWIRQVNTRIIIE
jgi:hypothetical protein